MSKGRRYLGWLIVVLALAPLPLFVGDALLRILVVANLYAIYAMSWDIFSGHTGYLSFGHGFLIGVAAYTTSLLNYHYGIPPYASIPIAILVSVLVGLLFFLPALRLRGSYFCLMTLLLVVVANLLVNTFSNVTGGDRGLTPLSTLATGATANFYITLVLMLVIGLGLWYVSRSNLGFVLRAIAQNEDTVEGVGIDTTKFKFFAFILSAIVASIGGCFWVHYLGTVTPSIISLDLSISIAIAAIVGGMGTITGPIMGAYLMLFITEYLRPFIPTPGRLLIFGLIGLIILIYCREGLMPRLSVEVKKLRNRILNRSNALG